MIYKIHKRQYLEDLASHVDVIPTNKDKKPITDGKTKPEMYKILLGKPSEAKEPPEGQNETSTIKYFVPEATLTNVYEWVKKNFPLLGDGDVIYEGNIKEMKLRTSPTVYNGSPSKPEAPIKAFTTMNMTLEQLNSKQPMTTLDKIEFDIALTDVKGVPMLNSGKRKTYEEMDKAVKERKAKKISSDKPEYCIMRLVYVTNMDPKY